MHTTGLSCGRFPREIITYYILLFHHQRLWWMAVLADGGIGGWQIRHIFNVYVLIFSLKTRAN